MRRLKIQENLIDKAVQFVAPQWGARRRQARMTMAISDAYIAGRSDRRALKHYQPGSGSPDSDINGGLDTMRARSRDLARNNPVGGGAIHTAVNHTVGTGLALIPKLDRKILGISAEEAKAREEEIGIYWRIFLEECDFYRKLDVYGQQGLALRSALENGDLVAILPWRKYPGNVFGTKIQLVEGDRLGNPGFRADSLDWSGGVHLDGSGVPIGYNIKSYHPGDIKAGLNRKEQEYPAYDSLGLRRTLHMYWQLRVDQHRGVPYLAPVVEVIKQLGTFTDAELQGAVVAAMFTVFTKTEGREGLDPSDLLAGDGETKSSDGDLQLKSGMVVDLAPGEDVVIANPGRPNPQFDPFVQALCRQVGMALEIPYEVLIKHFTASYSASRAALLELWKFVTARRAWLVREFCQPVYEVFMWELVSSGYVNLPGFLQDPVARRGYLAAEWIGDAMPTVDPVKDIQAAALRMENDLTTHEEESMALTGREWLPKVEQMKYERELLGSQEPGVRSQEKNGEEKEEEGKNDKKDIEEE
jgi:lambda family phage portal protein